MTLIFYSSIAITLVGLAGIFWFILRTRRLRTTDTDEAGLKAELRSLVVLNMAAMGLAFLGLALTVVGLILAP
jgi:hypothetical protein